MERDYLFEEYTQRQSLALQPDHIHRQAMKITCSDKFIYHAKTRQFKEIPYPGFAVLSTVQDNENNQELIDMLRFIASTLNTKLNHKEPAFFMLPEASYHQTVANTLSGERFQENIVNKEREAQFPLLIEDSFKQISITKRTRPLTMQMNGISIFGSCIALLGTFEEKVDFDDLMLFRKQFYACKSIQNVSIRWTRPFVGHITLGYLGRSLSKDEIIHLVSTVIQLNLQVAQENIQFHLNKTALKSYPHLSHFVSRAHYPSYSFIQ